jgi:hypothetical protein
MSSVLKTAANRKTAAAVSLSNPVEKHPRLLFDQRVVFVAGRTVFACALAGERDWSSPPTDERLAIFAKTFFDVIFMLRLAYSELPPPNYIYALRLCRHDAAVVDCCQCRR